MRLIDADALREKAFGNRDGLIHTADLDAAPTIDAVTVMPGTWEDKEVIQKRDIEEWQSARCSVCRKYHTTPYMYYFTNYKFCPHCGAKMTEDEKND